MVLEVKSGVRIDGQLVGDFTGSAAAWIAPYAETQAKAERLKGEARWSEKRGWDHAPHRARRLGTDDDFLSVFQGTLEHLLTNNPAQSPFAEVRLRAKTAKRYKRVNPATALFE